VQFKGFQDIEEHLATKGDGSPVKINELDFLVDAIVAHTELTREQSVRVLTAFLHEIRYQMLQGHVVDFRGLGSFSVSSPATTGNSKKIFPTFSPKKSLIKRLNNERK
jgi:nucleoid DNA-binding protein